MGTLPNLEAENWLVSIQRLMATVAIGLGQFQRFLTSDFGTGLHTCDLGIGLHSTHCMDALVSLSTDLGSGEAHCPLCGIYSCECLSSSMLLLVFFLKHKSDHGAP